MPDCQAFQRICLFKISDLQMAGIVQEALAEATPSIMLTLFAAIATGSIFFSLALLVVCRRFAMQGEYREPYEYRLRAKYALAGSTETRRAA
jgi:hypothetical protein